MRYDPMYEGADLSGLESIQSSAMSWDYIKRMRDVTKMKMVIKGILAWEDAKIAAQTGIDAIIVSNHGGRADESGRSTIESLPEIIRISGKMPVLIDSGFRRGTDFVKALCMGAKGVAIGRPYLGGPGLRPAGRPARAANPAHGAQSRYAADRSSFAEASKPSMVLHV